MPLDELSRRQFGALASGIGALAVLGSGDAATAAPSAEDTYLFLVFTDPVAGEDGVYAPWFTEAHLREMASIPGIVSGRHFVDAQLELRHSPIKTPHDLVLYTAVTARPLEVRDAIARRAEAGRAWPHPAVVQTYTYRAMQPPIKGAGGEPAGIHEGQRETYLVLAFGDALAGQEIAYNTWYDTVHEPELMSHPGVVRGQRAELSSVQMGPAAGASRYLMVVTIVTSDLPAVFRGMLVGGPPSPAMDRAHGFGFTFRAAGPIILP